MSSPDINSSLEQTDAEGVEPAAINPNREVDIAILRRLWPIGESFNQRPSRPIYKPIKFLCAPPGGFTVVQLFKALIGSSAPASSSRWPDPA